MSTPRERPEDLETKQRRRLFAWLVVSLVNMWVGVTKAGYSVREEFPILLIVFLVPALLAGLA